MPMFKNYNQNQVQLIPANLNDVVPQDHLAKLISKVIDDLDISFIEKTYSPDGQHAYHPKMLIKVLIYGYTIGLRSSRKLADKLSEDLVFIWLASRQTPDFRTIADFRKDRLGDIKKLFIQVINLCQDLGMIRIGKVSIDGTKFRANASGSKIQYRKLLEKRQKKTQALIDEILDEAVKLDQEEEKIYGETTPHTTGRPLTAKMKKKIEELLGKEEKKKIKQNSRRQETLKRKKAKLEAKQQDLKDKLWQMRQDRNTMSSTDKDATLMLMKERYIAPGYNAQLATEHQVILAYGLFSDRNDNRLLKPMVKKIGENTGKDPEIVPADAGYGNKRNYRFLKNRKIAAFIPYNNFNQEMILRNKGIYQLPKKIDVELERYKFRQRLRLTSKEGKELMKRRKQDIEPTFGDIKRNMNFRTFQLRGKTKCLVELGLVSLGHNLKKIRTWIKKLAKWNDGRQKGMELGTILGYRST